MRKPQGKFGPRCKYKTEAEMRAAQAAYDAVQALIAQRKTVLSRRRQARKRARDADTPQQRQRARRQSIARNECSPEKILALDRVALDNSKPFHVGVLGGCRKCHAVGCSCVERFVCTHCGAFLFAAEAKPTNVRGRFKTKWQGGNLTQSILWSQVCNLIRSNTCVPDSPVIKRYSYCITVPSQNTEDV
uniref:Uncharacterized protein n=1 Tax=Haptolina ericina TaxID=156174 RepID=A0A7S3AEQ2_9EUKA|mmetsp:Transcript_11185/g.25804  ORF Transcript_11185/g.25804 Transcript_11185/m.25804 type:complete len:189 (+) Transcript_11185:340-906(+)